MDPQQQRQPAYPQMGLDVRPEGLFISVHLAPGLTLTQGIGEDTMNEICKQWLETRKQVRNQLEIVRDMKRSKGTPII